MTMNFLPNDHLSWFINEKLSRNPETRREFSQFANPHVYSWWARLINELKSLKILSYGLSANGNTYEIRVRGEKRYVLRINSFALSESAGNGGIYYYLFDELMNKIGKHHIPENVVNSVCGGFPRRGFTEFVGVQAFGCSILSTFLVEEPQVEQVLRAMERGLHQYASDGEADRRKAAHAKKVALATAVPGIREFLRRGGTYEEMVEILQTELINSVQTD